MATLISPGVSVSVTDESFFFPVSATTVPLIFMATRGNKTQTNGLTAASGTLEHSVVRTVTSMAQSLQLYGVPYFRNDISGNEYHGDARNEYGLLALNGFLGIGNRAYVVRANVDLNDSAETFVSLGRPVSSTAVFNGIGNGTLTNPAAVSNLVKPQIVTVTFGTATSSSSIPFSVVGSVSGHIGTGIVGTPFTSSIVSFNTAAGSTAFVSGDKFLFALDYTMSPSGVNIGDGTVGSIATTSTGQFISVLMTSATAFDVFGSTSGLIGSGEVGTLFSPSVVSLLVSAGSVPFVAGDKFTFSLDTPSVVQTGTFGNGSFTNLRADSLAVQEDITVTFLSSTSFSVSNLFGSPQNGTVNNPFDDNRLNFTAVQGSRPFGAGDVFTVSASSVTVSSPLGSSDAQRRVSIVTALQACINSNVEVRSELYEYNLILCPGYYECVDELVNLSADIGEEALVLADTPCDLNPEQTAQWSLTSERQSKTSVAYYYPWAVQSNLDGRNVLGAPSGVALRTIAFSDDQAYVWVAPAGISRGLTFNVSRVGYVSGTLGTATTFIEASLNEGQRENLYEYDKNVNPIVFFPGRGILVWGQKTSSPAASALDRINAVRLVMYLRRTLRKGAMPFVFEPNDQITRDNLKAAADGIMNDIMVKRGLTDYASYCDASNNTADRIDRNELYLDIAIKITKSAEFIYIPIRVVSSAASI